MESQIKTLLVRYVLPHAAVIAAHIFLIRDLWGSRLAYTDFPPFASDFTSTLQSLMYSWSDTFIGAPDPKSLSYVFRAGFELFSLGNPSIAQNLYLLCFMLIGYWGMFAVLKRLGVNRLVQYIFPFFYFINPTISAELLNGAVGVLIPYAFLPLIFLLMLDLLEAYTLRRGILFSIVASIYLNNLQVGFWMIVWLALIPLLHVLIFRKNIIKQVVLMCLHGAFAVILNAVALVGLFSVAQNYASLSYLPTFKHNYAQGQISNLLRLASNNGSPQETLGYFANTPLHRATYAFSLAVVAYFSIFFKFRQRPPHKTLIALFALSGFILTSALIALIASGSLDALIEQKNLIIVSLRNPQKLLYMQTFSFIILISLASSALSEYLSRRRHGFVAASLVGLLVMIWVGYNAQFLGGNFGLAQTKGRGNYAITQTYESLIRRINALGKDGNVAVFPFDYATQLKLSPAPAILSTRYGGSMTADSPVPAAISSLYADVCRGRSPDFLLSLFAVKYVVLLKHPESYVDHPEASCTLESEYGTPYIWGDYDHFLSVFAHKEKIYEDSEITVLQLSGGRAKPVTALPYLFLSSTTVSHDWSDTDIFTESVLNRRFYFTTAAPLGAKGIIELKRLFADVSKVTIDTMQLEERIEFLRNEQATLYAPASSPADAWTTNGATSTLDPATSALQLPAGRQFQIGYTPSGYAPINAISNPSFEQGLWSAAVEDCRNYDDWANIGLTLAKDGSTGTSSLELWAKHHTACTHIRVPVAAAQSYVLSFDHKKIAGESAAAFYLEFNDPEKTSVYQKFASSNAWQTMTLPLRAPPTATSAMLYVYAYDTSGDLDALRYDNFVFKPLPKNWAGGFFAAGSTTDALKTPSEITGERINPTKMRITARGATTPFYAVAAESYHPEWRLKFASDIYVPDNYHVPINGILNGWYIDTDLFCSRQKLCIKNADGSYDLDLVMLFEPQKYYTWGLTISAVTLIFLLCILFWDARRRESV